MRNELLGRMSTNNGRRRRHAACLLNINFLRQRDGRRHFLLGESSATLQATAKHVLDLGADPQSALVGTARGQSNYESKVD